MAKRAACNLSQCARGTQRRRDHNGEVMYDQVCFYVLYISAKRSFGVLGDQEYSWPTSPSDLLTLWVYEILKKPQLDNPPPQESLKMFLKKGDIWRLRGTKAITESQTSALNNRLQHSIADTMYYCYCYYCQSFYFEF